MWVSFIRNRYTNNDDVLPKRKKCDNFLQNPAEYKYDKL